jgi:hypothetical protein
MQRVFRKIGECATTIAVRPRSGVTFAEGDQIKTNLASQGGMTEAQIHLTTRTLPAAWDTLAVPQDVFFSRAYMQALEAFAPEGMDFAYALFMRNGQNIGRAYFQIKHFDASEAIKAEAEGKEICFFTALSKWARTWVSKRVKSDVLVCGNLLCTGEHHFQFVSGIAETEVQDFLEIAVQQITEAHNRKFSPFVLIKDISPERKACCSGLRDRYTEFEIQPNMVLDLEWPDFAGYQAAMTTKYRTRLKRARKKRDGLELRQLNCDQMLEQQNRMYQLYQSVATNVGFNMVDLNPGYLTALCRALPDSFSCYGYFLDNQLIAFYTLIQNGPELEAHFIGYDKALNHDYQIYLNMLYDIVEQGLAHRNKRIVFARTALEIKSTVGAAPEQLYCYLRHTSTITNLLAPHVVEYLKPVEVWQQRHPFKLDGVAESDE